MRDPALDVEVDSDHCCAGRARAAGASTFQAAELENAASDLVRQKKTQQWERVRNAVLRGEKDSMEGSAANRGSDLLRERHAASHGSHVRGEITQQGSIAGGWSKENPSSPTQDLIKSAMSGRPNELLRRRRLAPRPRGGWAEHPVQCRLASFTDHRTASPLRLRLAVVYAEQPPAASSTNAGGACSAGPSGVGLGNHTGTVASARTKLGRPARSSRPSAPALQTRARFRHPLAEK